MILCGSFLAAAAFVWIFFRKKLSPEKKRMLGIVAMAAGMGVLAGAGDGADSGLAEGNLLERKEYGAGSYEEQLTLSVGEDGEPFPYDVAVPEQILTTAEEQAFLAAAVEEIAREFPGENASVNHIEGAVAVRDSYQEEKVLATWSFDQPEIVNMQGKVIAGELPGEGVLVKAKAVLVCGESERTEKFYFRVFPLERSGTEEVLWQIEKDLKEQGTLAGETHLKLPETVDLAGSKRPHTGKSIAPWHRDGCFCAAFGTQPGTGERGEAAAVVGVGIPRTCEQNCAPSGRGYDFTGGSQENRADLWDKEKERKRAGTSGV